MSLGKPPSFASHRGRQSLKLIGALRGEATLHGAAGAVAVVVDASEYEERGRTSISGSLDADLSAHADAEEARLVLADGRELQIRLMSPDEQGADFRTR